MSGAAMQRALTVANSRGGRLALGTAAVAGATYLLTRGARAETPTPGSASPGGAGGFGASDIAGAAAVNAGLVMGWNALGRRLGSGPVTMRQFAGRFAAVTVSSMIARGLVGHARADTPGVPQRNPTAATNGSGAAPSGGGIDIAGAAAVNAGLVMGWNALGRRLGSGPVTMRQFAGRFAAVTVSSMIARGLVGHARADTPGVPQRNPTAATNGSGAAPSGGGVDISGTAALAGVATAGAGYAGYRMLTRGAGAPAAAVPAIAAAPGRLARAGGLLRRAALPLTALAALNEASRGFTANGASGALRGAVNSLTFGALDMVAGPATSATANSAARGNALAGAQGASGHATQAITAAAIPAPGLAGSVVVSSDGFTNPYRRVRGGRVEQVSGYNTPNI